MATQNSFDLLDNDTEGPSLLIAAVEQQKLEKPQKAPASTPAQAQPVKSAKLPSKPLPPAQAVKRRRLGQVVVVDEAAMGSIAIREVVITPMDFQEGTGPMKREKEGGSMKGAAMLGLEVLSVEVAVGVLTMEKLEKGNTLAGSPQWDWTNEFKRDGAGRGNWWVLMKLLRRLKKMPLKMIRKALRRDRKMLRMPRRRMLQMKSRRRNLKIRR